MDQFLVTVPPQQLQQLRGTGVTAAHLAYRVGRGPRLLRASLPGPLRGGLMVVELGNYDAPGHPMSFCQEVLMECMAHSYTGVFLDFDSRLPYLERLANTLDGVLHARGLRLLVPESYGPCSPHAQVVISSALSGGTLTGRLREVRERFGRDRVVLALEKSAEDFALPSPSGCGTPLSQEELDGMLDKMRPCVFFSTPLCARYFTYMSRDSGAHFVLFDDGDTMHRKIQVAQQAGIHVFLLPWTQLRECVPIDGCAAAR